LNNANWGSLAGPVGGVGGDRTTLVVRAKGCGDYGRLSHLRICSPISDFTIKPCPFTAHGTFPRAHRQASGGAGLRQHLPHHMHAYDTPWMPHELELLFPQCCCGPLIRYAARSSDDQGGSIAWQRWISAKMRPKSSLIGVCFPAIDACQIHVYVVIFLYFLMMIPRDLCFFI
jgi:hypothetical protein